MINLQKKENFINDQMENNLNISEKSKINLNKGYFVSDKAPLRLKKRAQEKIHVEVEKMRFQCSSQNLIRGHKNDLNCKIEINRNAKIEVSEKEPKFLKRNYSLFLTKNDCLESDEKLLLYKKNLSNSRGNSKIYLTIVLIIQIFTGHTGFQLFLFQLLSRSVSYIKKNVYNQHQVLGHHLV